MSFFALGFFDRNHWQNLEFSFSWSTCEKSGFHAKITVNRFTRVYVLRSSDIDCYFLKNLPVAVPYIYIHTCILKKTFTLSFSLGWDLTLYVISGCVVPRNDPRDSAFYFFPLLPNLSPTHNTFPFWYIDHMEVEIQNLQIVF